MKHRVGPEFDVALGISLVGGLKGVLGENTNRRSRWTLAELALVALEIRCRDIARRWKTNRLVNALDAPTSVDFGINWPCRIYVAFLFERSHPWGAL